MKPRHLGLGRIEGNDTFHQASLPPVSDELDRIAKAQAGSGCSSYTGLLHGLCSARPPCGGGVGVLCGKESKHGSGVFFCFLVFYMIPF